METVKNNISEVSGSRPERMSGKEKMEAILSLFGTEAARESFIETCRKYIEARDKAIHESYAPATYIRRRAVISSPKQAVFHNQIMDTLTRLDSQAQHISPLQRTILIEMHDRDVTAHIVREYVASKGIANDEEEDEPEGRRPGMSDTAYYHSLGKD